MNPPTPDRARILIAGIGNIFLGDDAFGVEVVQRLARQPLPEGVRVVDFGIRGLDLAYALLDRYEAVILVDAIPRGGEPGTLYVVEPEVGPAVAAAEEPPVMETHNMDPARVLRLVAALGGELPRVLVVGCEPQIPADEDDMAPDMSPPVRAAVERAVGLVESLATRLLVCGNVIDVCTENSISRKEVPSWQP
jgi:hydrogenase maturation protease